MHSCIPPNDKCEWGELRYFVVEYNKKNNSQYELITCLDTINNNEPQPEVRLKNQKDNSARLMVIEKKIIVWPADSIKNHIHEHNLIEQINSLIKNNFSKGLFIFKFISPQKWSRQSEGGFYREIESIILCQKDYIEMGNPVQAETPFSWLIKKVDDKRNKSEVQVYFEWVPYSPDLMEPEDYNKAFDEIRKLLEKTILECQKKFRLYRDDLKILVLYSHTELLLDKHLAHKILATISVPVTIDQIWLAEKEYLNDDGDFMYVYNIIFVNGNIV